MLTAQNLIKKFLAFNFGNIQEEGRKQRIIKMVLDRQRTPLREFNFGPPPHGFHSNLHFMGEG